MRLATSTGRFASTTASSTEEKTISDALYRVRQVNYMPEEVRSSLLDFSVDGVVLGKVRPNIAKVLCSEGEKHPVFSLVPRYQSDHSYLTLTAEAGSTAEQRTTNVNRIMANLRDKGIVQGWRSEDYPVRAEYYGETFFGVERSAASLLGIMEYGVHINGIVTGDDGNVKMWMARRAADKSKYPGMLDHIVAGGQPVGLSLMENVIKECKEEAGIPEELTRRGIRSAGAISYCTYSKTSDCVTRCVLFCYDLHLPSDFVPEPVDGEVQEFFLWDVNQIKASFDPNFPDPIKPNCYNVVIDYLMRYGYFDPDTKGYLDVFRELRSGSLY
jgi:8-oxo-dGTP pyrophosphatase MutT (NUDIX family)